MEKKRKKSDTKKKSFLERKNQQPLRKQNKVPSTMKIAL